MQILVFDKNHQVQADWSKYHCLLALLQEFTMTKSPETTFQVSKMSEVDQLTDKLAGTVLRQKVPVCFLCNKHKVPCTECKIELTCEERCLRCANLYDIKRYHIEDGQTRQWNHTNEQFVVTITNEGLIECNFKTYYPLVLSKLSTLVTKHTTTSMESWKCLFSTSFFLAASSLSLDSGSSQLNSSV